MQFNHFLLERKKKTCKKPCPPAIQAKTCLSLFLGKFHFHSWASQKNTRSSLESYLFPHKKGKKDEVYSCCWTLNDLKRGTEIVVDGDGVSRVDSDAKKIPKKKTLGKNLPAEYHLLLSSIDTYC